MLKLAAWIMVLLGLTACAYWAAGHYVLRADEGVIVLEKRFLTFGQVYLDIRDWTAEDYSAHPRIEAALQAGGLGDIVKEARRVAAQENREEAVDAAKQLGRDLGRALDDFLRKLDTSLLGMPIKAGADNPPAPAAPEPSLTPGPLTSPEPVTAPAP